jgi:hypothetical protein
MTPDEERYLLALKRRRAALLAKDDLIAFAKFMRPDQDAYEDPDKSAYQAAKHHIVIATAMERVERGEMKRLIVDLAPRHGKSELVSRLFPAWFLGRNPTKSVIFATYNQDLANDFGRDVRALLDDPLYCQVFPGVGLKAGAASVDRLELEQGGKMFFTGVGGSITGRGADIVLGDDFVKGRAEADSLLQRDRIWKWFNEVLKTRLLSSSGRIVLINTRWTEDDVIGRLLDKTNSYYSATEAKKWKQISLPALARDNDVLMRKPGEALWPEKFPKDYLHDLRDADPRGFQALYMSSPTPEKGNFFDGDKLRTYTRPHDRPPMDQLRFYCASDHAVSTKQDRDKTCLITVGIDADSNIWVMDDIFWERSPPDVVIEAMIDRMEKYRPQMWFAERGHISKSIGPFLRKRMLERQIFTPIDEIVPVLDKAARAQSMRGRISMGMVYLPSYAPWYMEFKDELLKFPYGARDDAVDALSYIGLGIAIQHGASRVKKPEKGPAPFTMGWIKNDTRRKEREFRARTGGW